MVRAQQGDHDAFAELARTHVTRLDGASRLILRDHDLARDAVQEGFIRACLRRGGVVAEFSPDGTQVLAFHLYDQSTWLLEADGSRAEEVDWNPQGEFNWQRLAP